MAKYIREGNNGGAPADSVLIWGPKPLIIHGVTLPVMLSGHFVTPDFEALAEFYPEYRKQAGNNAVSFGAYGRLICEALAASGCREGRTADDWTRRIVEHFSREQLTTWIERFSSKG